METVLAALITVTVPAIFAMRASKHAKAAKATAAHVALVGVETRDIVRGNGHGTITALGERIEARLVALDGKVDDALSWQGRHEAQHRRTESSTT